MYHLRDFKNFERADLDLSAPLTILLGRNGSGKTNLIEGVELLGAIGRGVRLTDITDPGRGGPLEVRGSVVSCARFGTSRFGLRLDTDLPFENGRRRVLYDLEVAVARSGVRLHAERLTFGDRVLIDARNTRSGALRVTYENFQRGPNPHREISGERSALSRYHEVVAGSGSPPAEMESARKIVSQVHDHLRPAFVLEPTPISMRDYVRMEANARLAPNGRNLSAILFGLSKGTREQKDALQRITDTIHQIPEEPFLGIGFVDTIAGDVLSGFETDRASKSNGSRLMDARLLSNGTLRMLAVLTALETVPEASRLVIEEFDNGLHPSRARLLLESLTESAERRGLNVVVTTHNPAFMNALKESQFEQVWVCHRDETSNTSRVTRLIDLDDIVLMSISGELGNFAAEGRLEKQLDSGYEKQRERAVQQWLDTLS